MWKKLENQIRLYFGFSQTETRGTLILLVILTLLLIVPLSLKQWYNPAPTKTLPATEQQTLEQISNDLEQALVIDSVQKNNTKTTESKPQIQLFAFNPNLISVEDWEKLGIDSRLANRIQKYTEKGGRFRIKSDLQKIYGFPKDSYETLLPYIELPEQVVKEEKIYASNAQNKNNSADKKEETTPTANYSQKKKKQMPPLSIELNKADTATLKTIRGIGEVLSDRIVRFRDKIGGFYSINQLEEVYGLEGEVLEEMKRVCRLDTDTNIRKININKVNEKVLAAHPYISPSSAKIIVNYRKQHGQFGEVADLHKIKGISYEVIEKIAPYLIF